MNQSPGIVLITGGTGRLGRVFVRGFASHGWQVVFTSRSGDLVSALSEDVLANEPAARVTGVLVDLSAEGGVSDLLASLENLQIHPSSLVNSARDVANLKVDRQGSPGKTNWRNEFELSVVAAYEIARGLVDNSTRSLRSVVNISSMYGVVAPNPRLYEDFATESPIHYGVCKAALNHLTKELAVRLAPQGVRANSVSFGGVEGRVDEAFKERYAELCPSARMLEDDDVLAPVLFLASEGSKGITGHNLVVDGGWSAW